MLSLLAKVELFKGLSQDDLAEVVRQGRHRAFAAGHVLMRQGEPSPSLHVILSGRVRVERSHPALKEPVVLAELGPGECVGEMGVLDDEPRSATVIAVEETETLELSAQVLLDFLLRLSPEVGMVLLRTLSRRLRSSDELIERAARKPSSST